MKKVFVSDVSLRVLAEQKKVLSFRERLNIAQQLDATGIDAIELPPVSNEKEDPVIFRTIAGAVKNAGISIAAGGSIESLKAAWQCIQDAKKPCIQIVLPTSTVQMEYMYHLKAPKMLEKLAELCKCAASLCPCVEFVAQDASRAEAGFVAQCCKTAEENGAVAVTLCDDSGICFPEDFAAMVKEVKEACNLRVYVQPSNALKLAAACGVEAIKAGADGVKTAVCGDYLAADVLADIFRAKENVLGIQVGLDVTGIHNGIANIAVRSTDLPSSEPAEVRMNDGIHMDQSCTVTDVAAIAKEMGYDLSDEDNGKVFEEFKRLTDKKKVIDTRELEAIIASVAMQVPSTFHLVSYVVNSGSIIDATAHVTLEKDGEKLSGVSIGDGPIDAAFHAIEQIVGYHYELDDFQIHAVTKGREAVGSSLIRLRANGKLYSGNGVSTDVVGACIRAYINALNKIVYEEN